MIKDYFECTKGLDIKTMSTDSLVINYQELQDEVEQKRLKEEDYELFIAYWKELKSRGVRI